MLWPSLENKISHRFAYAEFREPPTVEASYLAMTLAKKCQLSMKTSSLAPPNFKYHLTTKPFSYETLKRQAYLIVIQRLCMQDMTSERIPSQFPSQDFCISSSSCFQHSAPPSNLYKVAFLFIYAQFVHHLFGEALPDYPG